MKKVWGIVSLALLLTCQAHWARAQLVSQTIVLKAGWNAVFLEVQPSPESIATVFSGMPVERVMAWNGSRPSAEYISDPSNPIPPAEEWLNYYPPGEPNATQSNLHTIDGGRAYLVKLNASSQLVTWTVLGRPTIRRTEWVPNTFNLVGFWIDPTSSTTFKQFFSYSSIHTGSKLQVKKIKATGAEPEWEPVTDTDTAGPTRGEAYLVYAEGPSEYSGPIDVGFDQMGKIDFGNSLVEQFVRVRNWSSSPRTIKIRKRISAEPVDPLLPVVAGEVPLSYWNYDSAASLYRWSIFPSEMQVTVNPGQEEILRLAVRRTDMSNFTTPFGRTSLYQSLIEITDSQGSRFLLPITANRTASDGSQIGNLAGLWVGTANIQRVSQPSNTSDDPLAPPKTASEFQFRIIVHIDIKGQSRFLQQVLQMWKEGTWKADPADPTKQIVDKPGQFVLITDDDLIPRFSGSALRDGKLVGRRISSAAFSFKLPIDMQGDVSKILKTSVVLDYDNPTNPFKHKFHPDHDNLSELGQPLPEGRESYTVTRDVELDFSGIAPDAALVAGWGDSVLGGTYREKITGIHRHPILVQGTFRLQRASRIGVLNDGL